MVIPVMEEAEPEGVLPLLIALISDRPNLKA